MILENIAGVARPVRIAANSSLACSTALLHLLLGLEEGLVDHLLVASFAVVVDALRSSWLGGQAVISVPIFSPPTARDDVVVALGAEDEHRQLVLHAQAERGRVGHPQALPQHLGEA